jgi:hypothetical protein
MTRFNAFGLVMLHAIVVAGCGVDATGLNPHGEYRFSVLVPRADTQPGCTLNSEFGSISINNVLSYTLSYEVVKQCEGGEPFLTRFLDRGTVVQSGSSLRFMSTLMEGSVLDGRLTSSGIDLTIPNVGVKQYTRN